MSDSEFERNTAVHAGDDGWVGEIDAGWNVGTNPNGGYTLAIAGRAMLAASGRQDPLTVTAHYVAPPKVGTVAVRVETVRSGRRYATLSAGMWQEGKELIRVLGAFGDLEAQHGPTRVAAAPPEIAVPDECVNVLDASAAGGMRVPEVSRRYDLRLDPASQWVQARRDGGVAGAGRDEVRSLKPLEVNGWIRFADGTEPSVIALLAMVDAFPPTLIGYEDVGWIPTIELTAHVRGRPAPGWLLGTSTTRFLVDGLLEQDGELWDSSGRLVALCRQMAIVLPRR